MHFIGYNQYHTLNDDSRNHSQRPKEERLTSAVSIPFDANSVNASIIKQLTHIFMFFIRCFILYIFTQFKVYYTVR